MIAERQPQLSQQFGALCVACGQPMLALFPRGLSSCLWLRVHSELPHQCSAGLLVPRVLSHLPAWVPLKGTGSW